MSRKQTDSKTINPINAQPLLHQRAREIQSYGTVNHALPRWQVAGPTFYQLHLLFDKHYDEQVELVDSIAERIQLLGGVSLAMAADVAETTQIERPPRGREEVPVQLSRLLDAHQIIIGETRKLARRASAIGDDGTNDLVVSEVLRQTNFKCGS